MRRAPYALVALAALVVATAPAHATACPLLTDAAGDVMPGGVQPPVPVGAGLSHGLDIVSADVASGATTVVGVLRVRSLELDPFTYGFAHWNLMWQVGGTRYAVDARRAMDTSGAFLGAFHRSNALPVPVAVAVDPAAGTFTWTVPRSWLPELAAPGATFDGLHARTGEPLTFLTDVAGTPFDPVPMYVDGTPGCVSAA
jgi:hypothetical protein